MAPSMASHSQAMPCRASYATSPCSHKATNICCYPLLETAMGGTAGADPGGVQRPPLAASTEHKEDGIHGFAIIDAGTMAPQRMRFARGEQGHNTLPQLVWPCTSWLRIIVSAPTPE